MRSKAPFFFFCLSTTCGAYRMTAPRCQFCTLFFFSFFLFFVGFHSVTRIVLCTVGHLVFLWMLNVHCSWPLLTAFVLFFFFPFFFWQSDVCAFVFMWNVPMYSCGVLTRKCERLLDLFHATCCLFFFPLSFTAFSGVVRFSFALLRVVERSLFFFFSFLLFCFDLMLLCCWFLLFLLAVVNSTPLFSLFLCFFFFWITVAKEKREKSTHKQTNKPKKKKGVLWFCFSLCWPFIPCCI